MRARHPPCLVAGTLLLAMIGTTDAATLEGYVRARESGEPLPSAALRLPGMSLQAESGPDGAFRFQDLPPGPHRLEVRLVGYRPSEQTISIADADTTLVVEIRLEPVAFHLRELVVRAPAPGATGSAETLTSTQVERVPATGDDLFRAVQTMAGTATGDVNASFTLRGGESDEILVRYDGIDLLEPYHIRDYGGAVSVLSLESVRQVRLLRGGLPARYGRKISGVLEVESPLAEIHERRVVAAANVSQARVAFMGPIGRNGSYQALARHGLLAAAFRTLPPETDADVLPRFDDVFASARFASATGSEVRFVAIGARDDHLYDEYQSEDDFHSKESNATLGVSARSRSIGGLEVSGALSADAFHRRYLANQFARNDDDSRAVRARIQTVTAIAANQVVEVGSSAEWEDARVHFVSTNGVYEDGEYVERPIRESTGRVDRRRIDGYASLDSRWSDQLSTTVGVSAGTDDYGRALSIDDFGLIGTDRAWNVGPRADVSWRPQNAWTFRIAAGRLYQPVFLNDLSMARAVEAPERARTADEATGTVQWTSGGVSVTVDTYVRSDQGSRNPPEDQSPQFPAYIVIARGDARGVEVTLRGLSWGRLEGWIAYARSNVTWSTTQGVLPRSFDQPDAAQFGADLRVLGAATLSVAGKAHSGTPYTIVTWEPDFYGTLRRTYGPSMGNRYPPYLRFDARLTIPIHVLGGTGRLYAEVVNVTDHENVMTYGTAFGTDSYGQFSSRPTTFQQFPRFPSLGLELAF